MYTKTYEDFLEKAVGAGRIELLPDGDLISLHMICKSPEKISNLLIKNNAVQALPLLTSEILKRHAALKKAQEQESLLKSEEPEDDIDDDDDLDDDDIEDDDDSDE